MPTNDIKVAAMLATYLDGDALETLIQVVYSAGVTAGRNS